VGCTPDSWKVTTQPTVEPITLAEAKLHLRVDDTDSDDLITSLISSARQKVEAFTRRSLITQTITAVWDRPVGDVLELPATPLASVTSVKQYAPDGSSQTVSAGDYFVDTVGEPGRVVLNYGVFWPLTWTGGQRRGNSLEVVLVAGYGLAVAVPAVLKDCIKEVVRAKYDADPAAEMAALETIRHMRVVRV
jgi:uncharacterized phiE125 gp8 family phage protein